MSLNEDVIKGQKRTRKVPYGKVLKVFRAVCIVEIFIPRVFSLQSLTLGTRVLFCGIFEQVMSPVVLNMVMFLIRPVS